ncbi:hypothetical protein KEJ39_08365 [Candidatus Bathyarchaeota archaeon]|nr:hypothetical protein [Candidatus Bathyarchaeota archaeon]
MLTCTVHHTHNGGLNPDPSIAYATVPSPDGSCKTALQESSDFREVFEVVRRSVKELLGVERRGLELYLRELPLHVGAFHRIGTNIIVMNRTLIDLIVESQASISEIKSFIYSILLHEYLHSLGVYDELQVRRLTYQISRQTLGEDHPATILAENGPWTILNRPSASRSSRRI